MFYEVRRGEWEVIVCSLISLNFVHIRLFVAACCNAAVCLSYLVGAAILPYLPTLFVRNSPRHPWSNCALSKITLFRLKHPHLCCIIWLCCTVSMPTNHLNCECFNKFLRCYFTAPMGAAYLYEDACRFVPVCVYLGCWMCVSCEEHTHVCMCKWVFVVISCLFFWRAAAGWIFWVCLIYALCWLA